MDIKEYFDIINKNVDKAYAVAQQARSKGFDPKNYVEVKPAPDLAARVEGIIGVEGIADIIKNIGNKTRQETAFELVKRICTDSRFEMPLNKRLTLAVRAGLSVLTEGVLVAPTEGLQGVEVHKNSDGTYYVAVVYAGPIRGAGGTSAALSVSLADYARKLLNLGVYKPTETEVERYLEEIMLYHTRCARLQYLPSEDDIRTIFRNCPVCIDGLPTEDVEVSTYRNIKRFDDTGKEQLLTNRVRGGVALVSCEGIAQKAKSVLKYSKAAGLEWDWLSNVIKIDKAPPSQSSNSTPQAKEIKAQPQSSSKTAVFLQELVAGRPVLAYPDYPGSFRLRYGRSRLTGIAAKGFNPATMIILNEFIAIGTQLKVEKPGKGCIAAPVDSIEGPFVMLDDGEKKRINSAKEAYALRDRIKKIIAVGDILVTYGDFKKTNTPLTPTSYVEEFWEAQLLAANYNKEIKRKPSFKEAFDISIEYKIPMHPLYIYEYQDITVNELILAAQSILKAEIAFNNDKEKSIFNIESIKIPLNENREQLVSIFERLCIPHFESSDFITIKRENAQSLISAFGFIDKENNVNISEEILNKYNMELESASNATALSILNKVSPFKIMRRSTRIGARIGRPEKAKERLMKPAPNVLFPVADYGGKDRSLVKIYANEKMKFSNNEVELEIARFRCEKGHEFVASSFCSKHNSPAKLERICKSCGRITDKEVCSVCNIKTVAYDNIKFNIPALIDQAMKNLNVQRLPKTFKGVKGLINSEKIAEPLEKGIIRAKYNINIFKDGTVRFDATDAPITHFYPKEFHVSVEKLRELGYTVDYKNNPLEHDDQLVELKHQDVILNMRGAEYFVRVAQMIDEMLVKFYKMEPFYNVKDVNDLIGVYVTTLSPHTSCGVVNRIVGLTNANVGFAHPYVITARRRNCDGDEDTTMLLLDMLLNFSKSYLPTTIGGTMDAPLILTINVHPEEVDDEVHAMEIVDRYPLEFYEKTLTNASPSDISIELVGNRLNKETVYQNLNFTHEVSVEAIEDSPIKCTYTKLKTMQEKIDAQFKLMDMLCPIDKPDTARKLILSHFIPDLMGNLHSFSKQTFRCVSCNAKYRRVPLIGKCTKCGGKLVLTISKGGIEKYLNVALSLTDKYNLEPYLKQRLMLLKEEIENVFGVIGAERAVGQFNLANYA
ncbi:MAG: DNA polymerase II large subunit [Candidatus Micrarchaeia archaeon]